QDNTWLADWKQFGEYATHLVLCMNCDLDKRLEEWDQNAVNHSDVLLRVLRTLRKKRTHPLELTIVGNGFHAIEKTDRVRPDLGPLLALGKTAKWSASHLVCRTIDTDNHTSIEQI